MKSSPSENRFDLGALLEFSTILNSTLDLPFILNHFMLTVMGKLLATRGIVLLEESSGTFKVVHVKGISQEVYNRSFTIKPLPRNILYVHRTNLKRYNWVKEFDNLGLHFLVPLIVRSKVVGISAFTIFRKKIKLTAQEDTYVKSLANIAAAAIEKGLAIDEMKKVNRELDRKIQELNTLFELSKEFNSVLDKERILKLLSFSVLGQIGVNRYFIALRTNQSMEIVMSKIEFPLSPELCNYLSTINSPLIIEATKQKHCVDFYQQLEASGVRVLVPFRLHNETKGVIGLGDKIRGDKYTQADLEFLSSLGNLAVISLENARLFKEALEKQKMEDELLIAREIQKGLLPSCLPNLTSFDISATNVPSKQVGGDYYDVIPLNGQKYVIAIGDVSGKGTPASLLMANLQATIRALVPLDLPLADLTARVNDLIFRCTGTDRFITFFWGILDLKQRTFKYVNAGHNPPILIRNEGVIERLEKGGIILGVMKAVVPYEEEEIQLNRGDILVLYTDGVTEAVDTQGNEFGEDRLCETIEQHRDKTSNQLLSFIVEAVRKHSNDEVQSDDITLLVIKCVD